MKNLIKTNHFNRYKTIAYLRLLSFILFGALTMSCSKDDDNIILPLPPTTLELLTSGKWYQESLNGSTLDACEKTSYWQFANENTLIINEYSTDSGDCILSNTLIIEYLLLSDIEMQITSDGGVFPSIILELTQNSLTIQVAGEVYTFDKTPG